MNHFREIEQKLFDFIKKYHTNEIIRGSILFVSFGLLYFFFTLFIEYFLWLKTGLRTLLFWVFVLVEFFLLLWFLILPSLKLLGFKGGLSEAQAAKIIGAHFLEVDDKLLNIIQLKNEKKPTDLILASIEQKSSEIQLVPFKRAINFKENRKYLKFLMIPLIIAVFPFLTGNKNLFSGSFDRVVHHRQSYQPPAPFYFKLSNNDLRVIEGKKLEVRAEIIGDIIPEEITINVDGNTHFMQKERENRFVYVFESVTESFSFDLRANRVVSESFDVTAIRTPNITDFEMEINYPAYTGLKREALSNTGNATVPEGSVISWKLKSKSTDQLQFIQNQEARDFEKKSEDFFIYKKGILESTSYRISSSNKELNGFENLDYRIEVINDALPEIQVKSDIDSISRGEASFLGTISDDYGLTKLEVLYRPAKQEVFSKQLIEIEKGTLQNFFYSFPNDLQLLPEKTYEIVFVVYDNNAVRGNRASRTGSFFYNQLSEEEETREILKEQEDNLRELQQNQKGNKQTHQSLDNLNRNVKTQEGLNWNNRKEIEKYLERQMQYQKMLDKNTDKILDNLEDLKIEKEDDNLKEQKEELKNRLEELKELDEKQRLLDELKVLTEKMEKEGLLENLEKLNSLNEQQEKSLERIVEMAKRFYVEKKYRDIQRKVENIAKEQESLSKDPAESKVESQQKLNERFDEIKEELQQLDKDNKNLKAPLDLPSTKTDEQEIKNNMKRAKEELEKESGANLKSAKQNQKEAANKMKKMAQKMDQGMMEMQMEMIDENIEDLERILNNLLIFSFDQEALMVSLEQAQENSADFPEKLKRQQVLKEYFEHIDDSLYTLSLRLVQITGEVQRQVAGAHYNIDKSLEQLSDAKVREAMVNQQYTMTAANDLADLLSNILNDLKNAHNSGGKGKSKQSFSLPDIIKKQKELLDKMENVLKRQSGMEENKEMMSEAQYKIFQEQSQLRKELNDLMKQEGIQADDMKKINNDMDQMERMLLEKGIDKQTLDKMRSFNYELLKLEQATEKQGNDENRKANSNQKVFTAPDLKREEQMLKYLNTNDVLIRQSLPLQPFYQSKVKEYFKEE